MPASQPHDSRALNYAEETVVASAARTSSSNSVALSGYGNVKTLRAQLNVTAASGNTPTLDVTIEDSVDGSNWNTIGTFAQKVTTGREVINVTTPFADRVRVKWVIGAVATPSFTFAVIVASETDPT